MIQKRLWNIQMIWMIFIKVLKNTIQQKTKQEEKWKQEILIVFNDMIADMLSNKVLNW